MFGYVTALEGLHVAGNYRNRSSSEQRDIAWLAWRRLPWAIRNALGLWVDEVPLL